MKQVEGRDGEQRPPEISVRVGERGRGWLKCLGRNPKSLNLEECQVTKENNQASRRGVK